MPIRLSTLIGAGVIGDIATPVERGGFFGIYNIGPNVGGVSFPLSMAY